MAIRYATRLGSTVGVSSEIACVLRDYVNIKPGFTTTERVRFDMNPVDPVYSRTSLSALPRWYLPSPAMLEVHERRA